MFKVRSNNNLVKQLQGILRSHGFVFAADNLETYNLNKKMLLDAIKSWNNYPKCMSKFPDTLSKKVYNEETTQYIVVR